jgi:hypothetical protein
MVAKKLSATALSQHSPFLLAAAVGVEDHSRGRVACGDGVAQRIGDQAGAQVIGQRESDDAAGGDVDDGGHSVECSFVAVHRIRVTWESSQVRTACGRQCLPSSDST